MSPIAAQLREVLRSTLSLEQRTRLRSLQTGSVDAARRVAHAFLHKRGGYHWVPDIYGRSSSKQLDIREEEPFATLARQTLATERTHLYFDRLHVLFQGLRNVASRLHPDEKLTTMEIGVYKGGGSYFIASVAEALAPGRTYHYAVDTFAGHSADDVQGTEGWHRANSTFTDTDHAAVSAFLSAWPSVSVLKGRIQDHEDRLGPERFHFIHLDVDIYTPTRYALDHYGERLVRGGIIVCDDYGFRSCPGVKRAVAEFMERSHDRFTSVELSSGQCVLARID